MTSRSSPRRRRARPALGTLVDITVVGSVDAQRDGRAFATASDDVSFDDLSFDDAASDDAFADAAFAAAFAAVDRIHRLMSAHDAGSDVRRLSESAHLRPVPVAADTVAVLRLALQVHAASAGLFDIAVGDVMARHGRIPPLVDTAARPPAGRSSGIVLHDDGRVGFSWPMHIDLGGIAKGHAVDCAVAALRAHGIDAGLVNAGGDMRAFGPLAHPVQLRFAGGVRTVALLADAALATSAPAGGDVRLAAHVDPRSRQPVRIGHSVMVQAPTAALADALTKVALLCPTTADRTCAAFGAEWRALPFQ